MEPNTAFVDINNFNTSQRSISIVPETDHPAPSLFTEVWFHLFEAFLKALQQTIDTIGIKIIFVFLKVVSLFWGYRWKFLV